MDNKRGREERINSRDMKRKNYSRLREKPMLKQQAFRL